MSMTADKSLSSPAVSPLAAISLKLVGVVTILSSLLDFLILLLPPEFGNAQWLLNVTTGIVDRGIVPFVGIALLLTGFWVDRNVGKGSQPGNLLLDLRFWSCVVASILGLVFLLLTFLHLNNVRIATRTALERVEQEASQAATQLEQRLEGELSQQQNQLQLLFQDEDLLQQAIDSGQLPQDVVQYRDDPNALDELLTERAGQARNQIETEIGTRREDAVKRVRREAVKSGIRISVSSFLLAIGYVVVGWTGLRRLTALNRA